MFMLAMPATGALLHPVRGFHALLKYLSVAVDAGRVVLAVYDDPHLSVHLKRRPKSAFPVADPTRCASPNLVDFLTQQAELRASDMNGQRSLLLSFPHVDAKFPSDAMQQHQQVLSSFVQNAILSS